MPNDSFIHYLPYDVFRIILLLCIDARTLREPDPIILSHVCRQWREYALDTPAMWSSLKFQRFGQRQDWAKQRTYLERSKSAPLDIFIHSWRGSSGSLGSSAIGTILRLLKPHLDRWRSFDINVPWKGMRIIGDQLRHAFAPALERLCLRELKDTSEISKWRCRMFGGGLPKLRIWKSDTGLIPPPSNIPHMANLRELRIESSHWNPTVRYRPTGVDIASMLSMCPNVEQLEMVIHSDGIWLLMRLPKTVISLPHLVAFKINNGAERLFLQLCHVIEAPNLHSIDSSYVPCAIIGIIASRNPFPALKTLTLNSSSGGIKTDLTPYGPTRLHKAFLNLSSLIELTIRDQTLPSELFQTLRTCCPSLVGLDLRRCIFLYLDFMGMVKARVESTRVTSLLRLTIGDHKLRNIPDDDRRWLLENVPSIN